MFFLLILAAFCSCAKLNIPKSKTGLSTQLDTVKGLLTRVLGSTKYLDHFELEIDPKLDVYFEVGARSGKILLRGSDGVSLSSAFNYYLRHFMKSSFTWQSKHIDLSSFPLPTITITKKSLVKYRYIFNTCTFGYTMPSWNFVRRFFVSYILQEQWERLIDWMALHGYNLPLSFVGQEFLWIKTFKEFGFTEKEMLDYFTGPLFLPWNRMGNIKKWAGPVSMEFLKGRNDLQKLLLKRQRNFGMIPVLPGFGGFVPDSFPKKFPNSTVIKETDWGSFTEEYTGNYLLDPTDPMFIHIGSAFIKNQIEAYNGTDHVYNADTFNEMPPKSRSKSYLRSVSTGVYNAMKKSDPDAVWMMQAWLFINERSYWSLDLVEAYLAPVPDEKMVILDLYSEEHSYWQVSSSYFGKPFIWCMLKDFGGHRLLWADLPKWSHNAVSDAKNPSSTMEGLGITSEAIFLPPVPYELFSDLYLYENPLTNDDLTEWYDHFLTGRYGGETMKSENLREAWGYLRWGAFSYSDDKIVWTDTVLEDRPQLNSYPYYNETYYSFIDAGYRSFAKSGIELEGSELSSGYMFDYVDVTRQFLSNLVVEYYMMIVDVYNNRKHIEGFQHEVQDLKKALLGVIESMDDLLSSNEEFIVGPWISDARRMGKDATEKDLFEFNARNQLTEWGPLNEGIGRDYAQKQWGGLVKGYYYRRWEIFMNNLYPDMNVTKYQKELFGFQNNFQVDYKTKYPVDPVGNTLEIGKEIYTKYAAMPKNYKVYQDTDAEGGLSVDISRAITRDIAVIANICNANSKCKGFNSNGWFKSSASQKILAKGVQLYVKL